MTKINATLAAAGVFERVAWTIAPFHGDWKRVNIARGRIMKRRWMPLSETLRPINRGRNRDRRWKRRAASLSALQTETRHRSHAISDLGYVLSILRMIIIAGVAPLRPLLSHSLLHRRGCTRFGMNVVVAYCGGDFLRVGALICTRAIGKINYAWFSIEI